MATNREGLTYQEWLYAAGYGTNRTAARKVAWEQGEDPSDHRAAGVQTYPRRPTPSAVRATTRNRSGGSLLADTAYRDLVQAWTAHHAGRAKNPEAVADAMQRAIDAGLSEAQINQAMDAAAKATDKVRGRRHDATVNRRNRTGGDRLYHTAFFHKISNPGGLPTPGRNVRISDNAFSNKNALAAALRKGRTLGAGEGLSAYRVEGDRVVAFSRGRAVWHSLILTPAE